jgi:hypothetical protein
MTSLKQMPLDLGAMNERLDLALSSISAAQVRAAIGANVEGHAVLDVSLAEAEIGVQAALHKLRGVDGRFPPMSEAFLGAMLPPLAAYKDLGVIVREEGYEVSGRNHYDPDAQILHVPLRACHFTG